MTREEREEKLKGKIFNLKGDLDEVNFKIRVMKKFVSREQSIIWHRRRRNLKKELKELNTQLETL